MQRKISLGFADDHNMLRQGLVRLIQMLGNYSVAFEAENGDQVIDAIKKRLIPDILVLDVNMGGKDGYQVAKWLTANHPQIKILVLSMYSDEATILNMIKAGAKGYLTKNADPQKLHEAIQTLWSTGSYIPDHISKILVAGIQNNLLSDHLIEELSEREKKFMKLLCKQLSYQEIAQQMYLSTNTMDDYRKKLTKKLGVKGKAGLIVYAMQNGLNK